MRGDPTPTMHTCDNGHTTDNLRTHELRITDTRLGINGHTKRMYLKLRTLAAELGTTERTLRRAVEQGLLRAHRPSSRKLTMPLAERAYLRRAWPLLRQLRTVFRTEPSVSLAVLFGSQARGDVHRESDVDVLVALRHDADVRALASRLSERLERRVQLVTLDEAERKPRLLTEVLRDGRVLVDRDGVWRRLLRSSGRVARAAQRESDRVEREFAAIQR